MLVVLHPGVHPRRRLRRRLLRPKGGHSPLGSRLMQVGARSSTSRLCQIGGPPDPAWLAPAAATQVAMSPASLRDHGWKLRELGGDGAGPDRFLQFRFEVLCAKCQGLVVIFFLSGVLSVSCNFTDRY
jgi:hypothetical protein